MAADEHAAAVERARQIIALWKVPGALTREEWEAVRAGFDALAAVLTETQKERDKLRTHLGEPPTNERIMQAHSAMLAEWLGKDTPDQVHFAYKQGHDERCYICTLVQRAERLQAQLTAAQKALRGIDAVLKTVEGDNVPRGESPKLMARSIARAALAAFEAPEEETP